VAVRAFSQQDFWSENENEGGWRILGKIASLFDARRDVDARSTGQKSHLSEKFQGFACAFGSDLPLWKFSLNSLRTTGEKKRESRFVQIEILFFSPAKSPRHLLGSI